MAFKIVDCDNVRENFTGAGSTTITCAGAVPNSRALSAVLSNADTTFMVARSGAEISVGEFTYTSSGTTVAQTDVWYSSNSNNAVSFSLGSPGEIFLDAPARIFDELNLKEITVASATTCDIGAVHGGKISISGTTTITGFGTSKNKRRFVRFAGALTLTHHATSLILPGAANITTAAGDTAAFASDSSGNWRCYFYVRADGSIVATTVTISTLLNLTAGQIAFPATQNPSANANTLDDYEEGTWTPVMTFVTMGNLSVAYGFQAGDYTKIGRQVTASWVMDIATFTHSSASGNARVTGLPFPSFNSAFHYSYCAAAWQGITKANYTQWNARVTHNVSHVDFVGSGSGQNFAVLSTGDMPTGGTPAINGVATYFTA